MQTNVEKNVELRTSVDAFATYEFCELKHPAFDLVAGPAASWKAILPSLAVVGEPFRLALVAEDMWGNPTADAAQTFTLVASRPLRGLPAAIAIKKGEGPRVIEGLVADGEGDVELRLMAGRQGACARQSAARRRSNAPLRRYWGDLHGQSGETIGMGSAEDYFRYARDKAFIDIVGHQGNDFQITDAFWKKLNELTAEFDEPGKFVCLPGYEWSGNTGMGGDRNVFYRREGRPIRRSSHILVRGRDLDRRDLHRRRRCSARSTARTPIVIAHVGGRYADMKYRARRAARARRRGAFDLGHVRVAAARCLREGLSRRRRVPQRRPQGAARRDAARRLDASARSAGSPATSCRS